MLPNHGPYEVYSDGSALPNRLGAWAFVIFQNGETLHEKSGLIRKTSSNHMEIRAALEALSYLPTGALVSLHTDSRVLIQAMTIDLEKSRIQNWKRKDGRPLAFAAELQALDEVQSRHRVHWLWVRAHSGQPGNERCDQLCREQLSI